jgi:hypothetical protein
VVAGLTLLWAGGCGTGEVPVGQEGSAINLARCYGEETDCKATAKTNDPVEIGVADCTAEGEPLEHELVLPALPEPGGVARMKAAVDGGLWVLSHEPVRLSRYSASGTLLWTSDALTAPSEFTNFETDLAVDEAGNATVAVYSVYAPNADVDLVESLTANTFDPEGQAVGDPVGFVGISHPRLIGAEAQGFVVAGSGVNGSSRGILSRIRAGEPEWVQTNVPGTAIAALALADDGGVSVLSQLNPDGDFDQKLGVSRFDPEGNPLGTLVLPTVYADGYVAAMVRAPNGDVVIDAVLDQRRKLVRRVSADGELGVAVIVPGWDPQLDVDGESGRIFVGGIQNVAVIAGDGQACALHAVRPRASGEIITVTQLAAAAPYLYVALAGGEIRRYPLASE